MIKAIMAVDEKGGISKEGSMPWPKNSEDLQWFKKNTLNQVVVMGSKTWEDPFMPSPLKDRINILFTNKDNSVYQGADAYFSGDISKEILKLQTKYLDRDIFIIGGSDIIRQSFELFKEFYLTRIYGNFDCDKFIDINKIQNSMTLMEKIDCDEKCHFEIWKK